ncbi:MAG: recombination mediator RecR [Lentimicrobiaceae bacterium]|nr:recombination mediator RecR [Lentimicrobiaceae bacterium]
MNAYPSKLLENAVNELSKMPGIGKRTALRLALHLLRQEEHYADALGNAILRLRKEINYCKYCYNISDTDICNICSDVTRDHSTICVVESIRDVMAIENTSQYRGVYHILGGVISPMEGIGPNNLNIEELVQRIKTGTIRELIMALPTTIEGETTHFYIYKRCNENQVFISALARGVAIGDELEYIDEVTLGRSILNRLPYENMLLKQ